MDSRPAFLPYSLLFLNISSLLLCIVIFILSLFNLTVLSVWINAGCALLGFIFHLSTFIIAWRKMSKRHAEQELRNAFSDVPSASGTTLRKQNTANDSSSWVMESYSSNALVGIYILLISWIIIFGIVIQSSISAQVTPSEINTNAGGPSLRVFNMVLIGIEIIVMGWLAIHYASIVRRINHKERLDADADFFDFVTFSTPSCFLFID